MGEIFILIEGDIHKSQFELWEQINKHLYNNEFKLISCNGITNVLNTFNSLYILLNDKQQKESLFIFDIDLIPHNMSVVSLVGKFQNCS